MMCQLTCSWAPPRVKFIMSCLWRQMLDDREASETGIVASPAVVVHRSEETMIHLLSWCSFSQSLWHQVLLWTRSTARPPIVGDDFADWWQEALLDRLVGEVWMYVGERGRGGSQTCCCRGFLALNLVALWSQGLWFFLSIHPDSKIFLFLGKKSPYFNLWTQSAFSASRWDP
jgi:hypothetical protein